jgi:hypothetical protein
MTRTGKIARLPRHLRDQLNRRLDDGEKGPCLLEWLNAQDDVRRVLEESFAGRPINEQNLSDWRQGGFLDWKQQEESRDWVRAVTEQADELSDESSAMTLTDCFSSIAAVALGKIIRQLSLDAPTDEARRSEFLRVLRELGRMRRDDLQSARLRTSLELMDTPQQNSRTRRSAAPA